MNETCSIGARCILSFNLTEQLAVMVLKTHNNFNEQLPVMVQKTHKVKESCPPFTATSGEC